MRIVLASVTLADLAVIWFYFFDFFFLACFLDTAPRAEVLTDVWGKSNFPDCVGYLVFIRTLNSGWDNICFSCFFIPFSIFCFWLSSCSLAFLPWGRNQRYRMLQQEKKLVLQAFVVIGADADPSFLSLTRSLNSQSSVTFSDHPGCSQGNEVEKNPDWVTIVKAWTEKN